jgi:flagellar FliL protein
MKRNLLSIIILALLIVNIVLTTIMMMNVSKASAKTGELVTAIANSLNLELSSGAEAGAVKEEVAMEDTSVYKIPDQMTIPLMPGEDGKSHFCLVSVALSMNTKHDDYETYGANIADKVDLIKQCVLDVIKGYTFEEAQANTDMMREDILKSIQKMYGSDFIYQVSFSDILFQ